MTNTIELTPAELEIIRIKREKEALELEEKQAKIQVAREKAILECKAAVAKQAKNQEEQIAAAQDYCTKLGLGWSMKIEETSNAKVLKGLNENGESAAFHREEFLVRKAFLFNGNFKVQVDMHVVYSSAWDSRGSQKGWKMYLTGPGIGYKYENKAIINAATINKKIKEVVEAQEAKQNEIKKQVDAVTVTVEKLKTMYPEASVVSKKEWHRDTWQKYGSEIDAVEIKFPNGVYSKWKIYSDGSLSRLVVNFGGESSWDTLAILNSIVK